MKNLMASEWNRVLIWALTFKCMLIMQCASTQDPGNGFMNFQCEMLPAETCAFAVDTGGFRCVLETAIHIDGSITYKCQTLRFQLQVGGAIDPSIRSPYIETDECINACGLQRLTVGISTDDELSENSFREKLCSPRCKQNCANIIDHYEIIMADQGEDLTSVCEYLTEYLDSESRELQNQLTRKTPARDVERSRRPSVSNKHNQILYEQAPGPSSDRAPGPNSDRN